MKSVLPASFFLAALAGTAAAQNPPPPDLSQVYASGLAWSAIELWGALGVIVFSLLVTVAAIVLHKSAGFSEDGVIRLVSLILIVSGTLFLVTLGYSAEQIAPALGILGTIAGYMLGKEAGKKNCAKTESAGS